MGADESSISSSDWDVIHKAWNAINADIDDFANRYFLDIFNNYPTMAAYFPFAGTGEDDFRNHTKQMLREIRRWVEEFETRPDILKSELQRIGVAHAKRSIDREQFVRVRRTIVKIVCELIGDRHISATDTYNLNKVLTLAFEIITWASDNERDRRGVTSF